MIIVRDTFHCKFGMGDQVVAMLKRIVSENAGPGGRVKSARVMTDISGRFFTVVSELEMESVDDHQAMLRETFQRADFAQEFGGMTEAVDSGHREYYTLEAQYPK